MPIFLAGDDTILKPTLEWLIASDRQGKLMLVLFDPWHER